MTVSQRTHPLRPMLLVGFLIGTTLLLGYGWIENRWGSVAFYLAILAVAAVFLAPPFWSYTRVSKLDESPEVDPEADSQDGEGE